MGFWGALKLSGHFSPRGKSRGNAGWGFGAICRWKGGKTGFFPRWNREAVRKSISAETDGKVKMGLVGWSDVGCCPFGCKHCKTAPNAVAVGFVRRREVATSYQWPWRS